MGDGIGIESRLNLPERFRYERVVRKAKDYRAGDRRVIADLSGPGCVRHFYCVGSRGGSGGDLFNRNRGFIVRFYWDGEEQPSIEVPLADLFGCSTATARPPRSHAAAMKQQPAPSTTSCTLDDRSSNLRTVRCLREHP